MSHDRILIKGNEAVAFGALDAGCRCYFGYPITPQNEIPETMSLRLPECGGQFVQAESEVAAINMLLGAGACGIPAMTSSSSCGISLMQEGISYMAGSHIPAVIVNMERGGPGLGDIGPSQGDYFQAVKGGGHGDYCNLVLAPYSVQEMCELMQESFELAEKYRNPVILLSDATLAKMRESVELPGRPELPVPSELPNALRGCGKDKEPHKVITCGDGAVQWGAFNDRLQAKYQVIREAEERWESYNLEDADIILVAYGSMARVCVSAMNLARAEGIKVGMIRPISLWPFPQKAFAGITGKKFLVCELSAGQMVEDVKLSVENKRDVSFFGKLGGTTPSPKVVLEQIRKMEVC